MLAGQQQCKDRMLVKIGCLLSRVLSICFQRGTDVLVDGKIYTDQAALGARKTQRTQDSLAGFEESKKNQGH